MSAASTPPVGVSFSRSEIARLCRAWGGMLWLPAGINGPTLLWALAGNESSFGANCAPRHEHAYDVGGAYAKNPEQAALLEKYGSAAACSYGPWQILLVNVQPAPKTGQPAVGPEDMARPDFCAMKTVQFLNRRILEPQKPTTVEEIAEAWNSGKWRWQDVPPGVETYAADCRKYYDAAATEMPPAAVAAPSAPVAQSSGT